MAETLDKDLESLFINPKQIETVKPVVEAPSVEEQVPEDSYRLFVSEQEKQEPVKQEKSIKYKGPSEGSSGFIDLVGAGLMKAAPFDVGHKIAGKLKSNITGEPYEKSVKDAKKYTESVFDYYGAPKKAFDVVAGPTKKASEWYTILTGAKNLLPLIAKAAGTPVGQTVATGVSKIPGVPAVGRALTSTNPLISVPSWGGLTAVGSTISNLREGESVPVSAIKGLGKGAEVAGYIAGGNLLPAGAAVPLSVAYTTGKGIATRRGTGEMFSPYEMSQDIAEGAILGGLFSKVKPVGEGIKGSPQAKAADIYKEPRPGEKSSTDILVKHIKEAPKKQGDTFFDLPIPETERFYKNYAAKAPAKAGNFSEKFIAPKKVATGNRIKASIESKYPDIRPTQEELKQHVDNLGVNVGRYTEPVRALDRQGEVFIPREKVDAVMGKEGSKTRMAFDNAYNAKSKEAWGAVQRPNEGYGLLDTLRAKQELSAAGMDPNLPYHREAGDKVRDLLGNSDWAKSYKQADAAYSKARDLYLEIEKNPDGVAGSLQKALNTIRSNADKNVYVNSMLKGNALTSEAVPAGLRNEMARYNYYANAQNILTNASAGSSSTDAARLLVETAAARGVGGRIANYLMAKTGIRAAVEHASKTALDKVVKELGSLNAEEVIKAIKAKPGNLFRDTGLAKEILKKEANK